MSRVRLFAFAIAVVLSASATAAADDAVKPEPTAPPVNPAIHVSSGDSWTYNIRDDVTGEAKGTITFEITKVSDAEIETRVTQLKLATNGVMTNAEIFDARWRLKDNGKIVFQPYLAATGIPEDLQVGKSWSVKYETIRKGAGLTREVTGLGKVDAWERVTLPNGTAYDAFKIEVSGTLMAATPRKHEMRTIMWFAPAVNRLVKRIDESRDNGKLQDATEQTLGEYKPAK